MSRKEKFLELIRTDTETLRRYGVKEIGIFGSVSKGEDHADSDYDVLVVFEPGMKSYRNFTRLVDFLESRLGASVDLLTPEGLSPHIGPHILNEVEYAPLAS